MSDQDSTMNHTQRPTDRLTVLLPPWLFQCVVADARRRMLSLSAVVRERLITHYRDGEPVEREHS